VTPEHAALAGDSRTEVAVVGAGIAGLATALLLAEAGRQVTVVEMDRVGAGETGYPPAKVSSQHGMIYDGLISKHGERKARAYAEADLTPSPALPIETTDRTTFRLCIAAAGLGLVDAADAPRALLAGELPQLNASGGLWAANPIFASGLERVARAVEHVRAGAPAAVAHSSFGAAGQGQLVAVLRGAA